MNVLIHYSVIFFFFYSNTNEDMSNYEMKRTIEEWLDISLANDADIPEGILILSSAVRNEAI